MVLQRPANKRKQIGLLVCPRKITSGYGRKRRSPFSTLTGRYSEERDKLTFINICKTLLPEIIL